MDNNSKGESSSPEQDLGTYGQFVKIVGTVFMVFGGVMVFLPIGCTAITTVMSGGTGILSGIVFIPVIAVGIVPIIGGYLFKRYASKIENFILDLVGQLGDAFNK